MPSRSGRPRSSTSRFGRSRAWRPSTRSSSAGSPRGSVSSAWRALVGSTLAIDRSGGGCAALVVGGIVLLVDRYLAVSYRRVPGPSAVLQFRGKGRARDARLDPRHRCRRRASGCRAWRELFRRRDPPHPWIGVAIAAAAALPLSAIRWPTEGTRLRPVGRHPPAGHARDRVRGPPVRATDRDVADATSIRPEPKVLGGRAGIASVIAQRPPGPGFLGEEHRGVDDRELRPAVRRPAPGVRGATIDQEAEHPRRGHPDVGVAEGRCPQPRSAPAGNELAAASCSWPSRTRRRAGTP